MPKPNVEGNDRSLDVLAGETAGTSMLSLILLPDLRSRERWQASFYVDKTPLLSQACFEVIANVIGLFQQGPSEQQSPYWTQA